MSVPDTEPASSFVDTNIWLYAFIEGDDLRKSARAKSLLEASRAVVVSPQVINEVCINLIRKIQFSERQVQQLIESFYAKYIVVEVSKALLLTASALREQYALSFWDSTIVAGALHAGASVLYSEDMQNGLVVESRVRIINPFDNLPSTDAQSRGSCGYRDCRKTPEGTHWVGWLMVKGRNALAGEPDFSYLDLSLQLHACLLFLRKPWRDTSVTIMRKWWWCLLP